MANETMVLLEKIVVPSGGASSVTFTSIPQSYTDLVVKGSTRLSAGDAGVQLVARFNGSTSGYSRRSLEGNGASASSNSGSSETYMRFAYAEESTNTANTFNNFELYIPNYTSSNNKSTSSDNVTENNATTAYSALHAGLWSNTSAITSISIFDISSTQANFAQYSTFYLYGVAAQGVTPTNAPAATGGDSIVFDGTYWIHTFRSSGTFTPKKNLTCDYLVVAGGGGGGANTDAAPGGGGAGGLRSTVTATGGGGSLESALSLTASTNYTVTIGAGGTAGTYNTNNATNGNDSVFSTITSTGGGRGATVKSGPAWQAPSSGGSGGGGAANASSGTSGAGTTNQGYAGGTATGASDGGGGGGGAGAAGAAGSSTHPNAGGAGVATSISGSSVTYARGGDGGGNGAAGSANTGNGGNSGFTPGGAGGSGIVIVRYAA